MDVCRVVYGERKPNFPGNEQWTTKHEILSCVFS